MTILDLEGQSLGLNSKVLISTVSLSLLTFRRRRWCVDAATTAAVSSLSRDVITADVTVRDVTMKVWYHVSLSDHWCIIPL